MIALVKKITCGLTIKHGKYLDIQVLDVCSSCDPADMKPVVQFTLTHEVYPYRLQRWRS
ncbi:hypothetical protein C0J52_16178 [Blattella germanica]|nr:hypothetical protein C0J52_16178 [Blattella germanica]